MMGTARRHRARARQQLSTRATALCGDTPGRVNMNFSFHVWYCIASDRVNMSTNPATTLLYRPGVKIHTGRPDTGTERGSIYTV